MTREAIRAALETAEDLPEEALRAATADPQAIAPAVIAAMERAAEDVHILPREENLLFFGLHALAAARETSAWPAFLRLLRLPEDRLNALIGIIDIGTLDGLLLGLYDGDPEPLFAMIAHPAVDGMVKWSVFQILARLAWEERIPRARVVDLLDRFDRDDSVPPDDDAWMGWESAILLLGLEDFVPRLRAGWEAGRCPLHRDIDRADALERIAAAAAHPEDAERFAAERTIAFDDAAEALRRYLASPEEVAAARAEGRADPSLPPDPAADSALNPDELRWLDGFLVSTHVPEDAMPLETLDGYMAALAASPVPIDPEEWTPQIWSRAPDAQPRFADAEQARFVHDLVERHWKSRAARARAAYPAAPLVAAPAHADAGADWADGFLTGVQLREDAWAPLLDDRRAWRLIEGISRLLGDPDRKEEPLTRAERQAILDGLGRAVVEIHAFWHQPDLYARLHAPRRATKIGRNDPCPCGSGKKYKKCCGAG